MGRVSHDFLLLSDTQSTVLRTHSECQAASSKCNLHEFVHVVHPTDVLMYICKNLVLSLSCAGVGKTSLIHLIVNESPITNPRRTIGCAVDVKVCRAGQLQWKSVYWS